MSEIITDEQILRQVSKSTTYEEVERLGIQKKLIEACKTAWTKGAGLAAIQIGIPLRFAWYKYNDRDYTLLNPEIIAVYGSDIKEEGCLSVHGKWTKVERAWTIDYITNGQKKTVSGFLARLIQHEIDHMDGILNIDKEIT